MARARGYVAVHTGQGEHGIADRHVTPITIDVEEVRVDRNE